MAETGANDAQIAFWNGKAGEKWAANRDRQDRMVAAPAARALEAAGLRGGERALDVGCGCGSSTFDVARAVGPRGSATGIDVSRPMLAEARRRARALPELRASFVEGDAARHPFPEGAADAVHSRFGVMFFAEPGRAFANFARALRRGGRLSFVCWRRFEDNEWARAPFDAASATAALAPPQGAGTPGPFALCDEARLRRLVEGAGFREVDVAAFDGPVTLGETAEDALRNLAESSPIAAALAALDGEARRRAKEAVAETLAPFAGPGGVRMGGAAWIVTARKTGG